MKGRSLVWKRFTDALGRELSPEEKEKVGISLFLLRDPDSNTLILGTLPEANALQEEHDDMRDFPAHHDPILSRTLHTPHSLPSSPPTRYIP